MINTDQKFSFRRLAFVSILALLSCCFCGAKADSRQYEFESGIPDDFFIEGVGWETIPDQGDRDDQVLSTLPMGEREKTTVSFTVSLHSAGTLTFDHRSIDYRDQTVHLIVNGKKELIESEYGQWTHHKKFLEKGETTISWQVESHGGMFNNPGRVSLDSISVYEPENDIATFRFEHEQSMLYPHSSNVSSGVVSIDGEIMLRETIDHGQFTFSALGGLTPAGSFLVKDRPVIADDYTAPEYFEFNGKGYHSFVEPYFSENSWLEPKKSFSLADSKTNTVISTWTNEMIGEVNGYRFADVNDDGELELILAAGSSLAVIDIWERTTLWQVAIPSSESISRASVIVGDFTGGAGKEIVVSGKPGLLVSAASGEVLWSYPLGFDAKLEKGDLFGDSLLEFASHDISNNVVVFDPRARSPSAVLDSLWPSFEIGDFVPGGNDEILGKNARHSVVAVDAKNGETLKTFDTSPHGSSDFFGVEINRSGELIIGFNRSFGQPQRPGLFNLTTGQPVGFTHSKRGASSCCLQVGIFKDSADSRNIIVSNISPRFGKGKYRIHVVDSQTLAIDEPSTARLDALIGEDQGVSSEDIVIYADSGGVLPNGHRSLIAWVRHSRPYPEKYSIYLFDLDAESVVNVFHPVDFSEYTHANGRDAYKLSNNELLIAAGERMFAYNVLDGNLIWESVDFGGRIRNVFVFEDQGVEKIFVITNGDMAVIDGATKTFDSLEAIPAGLEVLNISPERREIYLGPNEYASNAESGLSVVGFDDLSEVESLNTVGVPRSVFTVRVGSQDYLFVSSEPDWLEAIALPSGETVGFFRTGFPYMGQRRLPRVFERDATSTTVLLHSTLGLHRYKIQVRPDLIFADRFLVD